MKKTLTTLLTLTLTAVLIFNMAFGVYANTTGSIEKLYIKDVIFIYGENKDEAKSRVPDGYTMMDTDLNQGTAVVFAVDDVYLAYSTTTNPDEAITDIKMMNMNGGYSLSDYDKQISNVADNIKQMAEQFGDAVREFQINYATGNYGAQCAYAALNAFTVDEAGMKLGDYLLYGNPTFEFNLKLLLNAHTEILTVILTSLAMAVQGREGNTWLDRLTRIYDPNSIYDNTYWDKATDLWPLFDSFYNTYSTIDHELFRNGNGEISLPSDSEQQAPADITGSTGDADVENTGLELFYEISYAALETKKFGNGTSVAEWLVRPDLYEEHLYSLISVLTPGEYAMMRLCGPMFMILGTGMGAEVYGNYLTELSSITNKMGYCSVWHGVNTELFRSSIGITHEAARAIAETKAAQELNNDGDSSADGIIQTAKLISAIGAITLGAGLITLSFTGSAFSILAGAVVSTVKLSFAIMGSLSAITGIAIIAVALVLAVVYLVVWLVDLYNSYHPEYTDIPEYMYDMVTDSEDNCQFILYEAVKDHKGKCADVNAFEGKQWHAAYVSRDKAAGNPIEADVKIKLGDGRVDEGYAPLSNFGEVVAVNLNAYNFEDDVKGIYISYRQTPRTGTFAKGKYLSNMKLFTGSSEAECKSRMKAENYSVYNLNITPNSNKYTFIGYKTTNRADRALTDIRFCYGYSANQYSAGGANETYAASGTAGNLTLYTTRISTFGTPILSDFAVLSELYYAAPGYEPVNFFSGGPAVNVNPIDGAFTETSNKMYIFFLPSVTYTSGPLYLGGVQTMFDGAQNSDISVLMEAMKMGLSVLWQVKGNYSREGAIAYTTTRNPYRAIYGITALSSGGNAGSILPQTIRYNQVSYTKTDRYSVNYANKTTYDTKTKSTDTYLYVAGVSSKGSPMTVADIRVTDNPNYSAPGYIPVTPCLSGSELPANISTGLNYTFMNYARNVREEYTMDPLYVYVRGSAPVENTYITNLYITSKEDVLGGVNADCSAVDNSYLTVNLAAQGATSIIRKNLNLKEGDNVTYLGYSRNPYSRERITDIIVHYASNTKTTPDKELLHNGIVYHMAGNLNLFCKENGANSSGDRAYIYYTTNPAAGDPIMDIAIDSTPIKNGWQTVLTQNGKPLYREMGEDHDDTWYIHIKRAVSDPEYVSEIIVGWGSKSEAYAKLLTAGCDYMVAKDLNDNVGAASDYIYLGYKRTSNVNEAIRDIRTTHDKEVDTFTKNGATYYKVAGNLNSFTNIFADDIFFYYTKDVSAGAPITGLSTHNDPLNYTSESKIYSTVVKQDDKPSDLNDGALGSYIYLILERNLAETSLISSLLGSGSVAAISALAGVFLIALIAVYIYYKRSSTK